MFTCNHITINCSDIEQAYEFYVTKLGLTLLARWPRMIAVRAGDVRFSISQSEDIAKDGNIQIILRTENIESERDRIVSSGIPLLQDIVEAPNFMRFFTIGDPDGNALHIGEYLRDPLAVGG